jgi:hypothetical protein
MHQVWAREKDHHRETARTQQLLARLAELGSGRPGPAPAELYTCPACPELRLAGCREAWAHQVRRAACL